MSDGNSGTPPNGQEPGSNAANGDGTVGYVNPTIAKPIWQSAPDNGNTANGNAPGQSNGSPAPEKRGRGRPKGSGNKAPGVGSPAPSKAAVSVNASTLEKTLATIHATLALGIGRAELALDDDEARQLAKALADVQAQYNMVLDPKTAAWFNLMMVAFPIYGSRAVAIYMERVNVREVQPQTEAQPEVKPEAKPAPAKSNAVFSMAGVPFDPLNQRIVN